LGLLVAVTLTREEGLVKEVNKQGGERCFLVLIVATTQTREFGLVD